VAGMVKWASAHRGTKVISLLHCQHKISIASLDRKLAEVGTVGDIAMMNVPLSCMQAASIASCGSCSGHGGVGATRLAQEALSNVDRSELTGTYKV
jgi:hypothetical protein